MKFLYSIVIGLVIFIGAAMTVTAQSRSTKRIVVEAEVVQVGEPPSIVSGARRHVYQLVKYKVKKVLRGSFDDEYIVVDYLIFSKAQLNGQRVGSLFVLDLSTRGAISPVPTSPGIRENEADTSLFFIPNKPPRLKK